MNQKQLTKTYKYDDFKLNDPVVVQRFHKLSKAQRLVIVCALSPDVTRTFYTN